jgi:hypothetical protein
MAAETDVMLLLRRKPFERMIETHLMWASAFTRRTKFDAASRYATATARERLRPVTYD